MHTTLLPEAIWADVGNKLTNLTFNPILVHLNLEKSALRFVNLVSLSFSYTTYLSSHCTAKNDNKQPFRVFHCPALIKTGLNSASLPTLLFNLVDNIVQPELVLNQV